MPTTTKGRTTTINEKDLQRSIISLADFFGWKVAHFGSTVKYVKRGNGHVAIPDKGAAGFPDLVLVRPPRLIFAELKTKNGKVSDEQYEWLQLLKAVPGRVEVYTWRPQDWEGGGIQETLK